MNEQVEAQEAPASDLPPAEERDFVVAEDLQQEARPEWLPEKYNSGEDLAKAYKELESKLGSREEDLRNKFIEELNQEAYADRPDSAGDYQLPEFIDDEAAVDSEVLKWWADHSFESGLSQSEFEEGLSKVFEVINANQPDFDAELEKLGDNANARIEAASLFSQNFFPSEHMPAIERLTETADGLIALEFIMDQFKSPSVNTSSNPVDQITEDSLRAMMQDERYWNPARRDMGYVRQVDEGFQKLAQRG